MSAAQKAAQRRLDAAEWANRQSEPFEILDVQRELGFSYYLVRDVLRDLESRGLLARRRGAPKSRPARPGGAVVWVRP